ncbi:MAG: hypothetical protein GX155_11045 [Smithella sp.]|nr:hypothetical protein [Smithella sp.]
MKLKLVCTAFFAAMVLLMPQAVFPQDPSDASDCVVKTARGLVNWSAGYVEAVGIAAIPEQNMKRISARPAALHNATVAAGRNLLELTKNIAVDSVTTVRALTAENDIVNVQIEGLMKKAVTVDRLYLSDGTVEVKLRLPLYGELSQIVTPSGIEKRITALLTPRAAPVAALASETVTPGADAWKADEPATGLIIDARGLGFRPAIWPHLYDESGAEIYGFNARGYVCADDRGISGYAREAIVSKSNERAGAKPLIIKALGTAAQGRSDLIISNADAARVLALEAKDSFLQHCRVVIVME